MIVNGSPINGAPVNGTSVVPGYADVSGGIWTTSATIVATQGNIANVTGGMWQTAANIEGGAIVSGANWNTTLTSAAKGTTNAHVSGGKWNTTATITAQGYETANVSGGRWATTATIEGAATVTGGRWTTTATITGKGYGIADVAGGLWNTTPTIAATGYYKANVTGGLWQSALFYSSVTGNLWATTATITDAALATNIAYNMNIRTGAVSRYTNYAFDNIIAIDGTFYGVRSTGFYPLEGSDDAGTKISSYIVTGEMDFGSNQSKFMPYVYLDSDTKTTITPYVDGVQKTAVPSSFGGRKTLMSKGNQGRFWKLKIADLDKISGMELMVEAAQRRVK